jgi:hypothetical protein
MCYCTDPNKQVGKALNCGSFWIEGLAFLADDTPII